MKKTVAQIFSLGEKLYDTEITVSGYCKSFRDQSNQTLGFLTVVDGSTPDHLQVVLKPTELPEKYRQGMEEVWKDIKKGVGLTLIGKLASSPAKGQEHEFVPTEITVYPHYDYFPLSKEKQPLEVLRDYPHLRGRTHLFGSVMRLRHSLEMLFHGYFDQKGFYHIATPILTSNDCEGAGEAFRVTTETHYKDHTKEDFFTKPSYLTVSGQLQAEAYALGLTKVYTFAPTFRAENSHTSRHLAEFWMMEPEVAFITYQELRDLVCDMFQTIIKTALNLEMIRKDINLMDKVHPGLVEKLEKVVSSKVIQISYTEAIDILKKAKEEYKVFISSDEKVIKKKTKKGGYLISQEPEWGIDMGSLEEKYLTDVHFKAPVLVYDYPASFKSFYMKENDDKKTVQAFDFLVPGIGELIGGSMREDRLDVLKRKMKEKGIKEESLGWYLDLRKFSSIPHGGYGLGFERFVQYVSGMANIRDVIPFPRTPGNIFA